MDIKHTSLINKNQEREFLNNLGKKIKQLRIEKDWSQEKLGFKSNLDRSYIGGIERGERNLTILNLKKIADALEISVKDIFI